MTAPTVGPFRFKQFTIHHDRCAMKVGTDGVLLGAWADGRSSHTILDIGTGSGVIALMLAQRFPATLVDAVEIDPVAAEQAQQNIFLSPWRERLSVFPTDIELFQPDRCYDLIVSNPPYFLESSQSKDQRRSLARHSDLLSRKLLTASVIRLLSDDGRFCVVLPFDQSQALACQAEAEGLYCHRICEVYPAPNKLAVRSLLEFRRQKPTDTRVDEKVVVEVKRHQYSEAFRLLTRDFYLKH